MAMFYSSSMRTSSWLRVREQVTDWIPPEKVFSLLIFPRSDAMLEIRGKSGVDKKNKLNDVYENTYKIPFDCEIPKDKEVFPRAPLDELVFKLSMEVTRVVHQPIYYRFFRTYSFVLALMLFSVWNTYQHTSFIYENSGNVTLLPFNSDRRFATRPHPLLCTLKRTFTISRIPYNTIGTSSFQLHLKSGDIHPNPGPNRKRSSTLKYPCGECQHAVRKKQDVILFAECKTWFHAKCIYMGKQILKYYLVNYKSRLRMSSVLLT